jgi:undecaprenyl-diphosphatase
MLASMQVQSSNSAITRALARCDLIERGLCLALNRWARRPGVRGFFATVSRLGDGVFWYLLMLSLPLLYGMEGLKTSLLMAAAGVVGLLIYKVMKAYLVRERPFASHPGILCGTAPLDRYSFPSGHTLHAVLFTSLALASFPALWPLLLPFSVLVALSRVILGLHYPSDVVVGAVIGWGLAWVAQGVG